MVDAANRSDPTADRINSHYALRRRTLERMRDGSTDLDAATMRIDPSIYTDPVFAQREHREIFHDLPVVAGLTMDIPEPGDMMVFDVLGPSILLVRSRTGQVNAFLNMCTHRAARLVTDCSSRKRMTCRFHAWTFDLEGQLIGQPGKEGFDDIDKADLSLRRVPVVERHGLIFVRVRPGADPIDIDAYLGDFGAELAHLELGKAKPVRHSEFGCKANWKYAFDTYGESYHFASLHPTTIGQLAQSNIMVYENYGLHARLGFPRSEFQPYKDLPEAEWPHTDYGGLYLLFPNLVINVNSIPGVGQFYGVSRVFPGSSPDRSTTLLATYQPAHADGDIDVGKWSEMHDFIQKVVTEEDYSVSESGQHNLQWAPPGFTTVLGRNEIALQHWHRNFAQIMASNH